MGDCSQPNRPVAKLILQSICLVYPLCLRPTICALGDPGSAGRVRLLRRHLLPRPPRPSGNGKWRSLNEAHALDIRYRYPLVHMDGSDSCAVPDIGRGLSTHMVTVLHRGKAKLIRLFGSTVPRARATHEPTPPLPYEIVEMIIAHFAHDIRTLWACSWVCHSWYSVATQHLHHTLTLNKWDYDINCDQLGPVSKLRELGLLHLVKEIRVEQAPTLSCWFVPRAFNVNNHFSALANVHTLRFDKIEIRHFMPDAKRYFGHFSPTLRSIALHNIRCAPRQLSYFLSLFPNLDDVEIRFAHNPDIPDTELVPFSAPKLRGRLVVRSFSWAETWTHLIAICGGLRFRHMDLSGTSPCAPLLLKACAETLETLRFWHRDDSLGK